MLHEGEPRLYSTMVCPERLKNVALATRSHVYEFMTLHVAANKHHKQNKRLYSENDVRNNMPDGNKMSFKVA